MASNPPLTDEEICRKFEITVDDPTFATAKGLSHNRHDRTICQVPDCQCPHCGYEFTATYYDLGDGNPSNGKELGCEGCERSIYIEHLSEPNQDDDEEFGHIYVTFNTDPEPSE